MTDCCASSAASEGRIRNLGLWGKIGPFLGPFRHFGPIWDQVPNLGPYWSACNYAISIKRVWQKILVYAVLSRGNFFREFTHFFWRTFYRPKQYGGVPKMTNMRYVFISESKDIIYWQKCHLSTNYFANACPALSFFIFAGERNSWSFKRQGRTEAEFWIKSGGPKSLQLEV